MKALTLFVLMGLSTVTAIYAGEKGQGKKAEKVAKQKLQTTCPVMGGKINKALYADVNGKRIYVCCKGCIGMIKKNPGKYIGKLEKEGVAIEKAPKKKAK